MAGLANESRADVALGSHRAGRESVADQIVPENQLRVGESSSQGGLIERTPKDEKIEARSWIASPTIAWTTNY